MFENMRLIILFDTLLSTSFKMTTCFANRANIYIYLYAKKDVKSLGIGSWNITLILNESKTSFYVQIFLQKSLESFKIFIWYGVKCSWYMVI